jgi:hypothetical protein
LRCKQGQLRPFNVLQAPYIQVKTKVAIPGMTNGVPNVKYERKYVVAPTGKKIASYIVNQVFGSELVTQTEGLEIGWLMPTLKEALELAVYEEESFIYLHKYENKVYLECIKKNDIHNLVQKFDKVKEADIIQDYDLDDNKLMLKRHIEIDNGTSTIQFEAFERTKNAKEWTKIPLARFNKLTGSEYLPIYNLGYEVLVNLDIGENFFKDSEKLLNEEMLIVNTIAEEIEKTKTKIVTTEHYQTTTNPSRFVPGDTTYNVRTLNVNSINDYFTLLPGDKDKQLFEFLQGDIRIDEYEKAFKFYDYQIIQMAGLSTASFGYEKDAYMNKANVELSANASEMMIEAIKTQITSQIDNLIENIIKLQQSQNITENELPTELMWDFGSNERFDDMKKIEVLNKIQRTMAIPYKTRVKIVAPLLNKLIDENVDTDDLVQEYQEEADRINVEFGEI